MNAATESLPYRTYGNRPHPRLRRFLIVLVGLVGVATLALGAQAYLTRSVIVPGVSVAGVDVGGLTPAAAKARLLDRLGARLATPITLETGAGTVAVRPVDVGISIDVDAAVTRAMATGRIQERLMPYVWSAKLDAPLTVPPSAPLPAVVAALARPVSDASLTLAPDGTPTVVPAVDGRSFDSAATFAAISRAAQQGAASASITPTSAPASITTAEAETAAARVRAVLAQDVTLTRHGKTVGTVAKGDLAPLVRVAPVAGDLAVSIDASGLSPLLGAVAKAVARDPVDAAFKAGVQRVKLIKSIPGLALDPAATALAVGAVGPTHRVAVAVTTRDAKFSTADAQALGIKEALFAQPITTQMGASSSNRIWNVHLLATILDGHIIKAGETFDFNPILGERTTARGFRVGMQIENGVLVPAVGGGVCQVATTLYDAAFYAGLAISSRTNHMFYLSHYPLGMDATVSWGGPELRFVNTLKHAILIKTSYTNSTMSIQFYGTREGITVSQVTGPKSRFTSPGVKRVFDPALQPGQEKRAGGGEGGFDVTVFRTVKQNGKVLRKDSFTSHYIPQDVIVSYGPPVKAKPKPKPKPVTDPPASGPPTATQ